jgi:hypothetical protein
VILIKVHDMHVWKYHNEIPLYNKSMLINKYSTKKSKGRQIKQGQEERTGAKEDQISMTLLDKESGKLMNV